MKIQNTLFCTLTLFLFVYYSSSAVACGGGDTSKARVSVEPLIASRTDKELPALRLEAFSIPREKHWDCCACGTWPATPLLEAPKLRYPDMLRRRFEISHDGTIEVISTLEPVLIPETCRVLQLDPETLTVNARISGTDEIETAVFSAFRNDQASKQLK